MISWSLRIKLTSAIIIKKFVVKVEENHKCFSFFNIYDSIRIRFNRMSLIFLSLIEKIYYIGLFSESAKQ